MTKNEALMGGCIQRVSLSSQVVSRIRGRVEPECGARRDHVITTWHPRNGSHFGSALSLPKTPVKRDDSLKNIAPKQGQ